VADLWLIAGLGNPDPEYERTRHNLGFMVADELTGRLDARFKRSKHEAFVAEARDDEARLILAKPQTYMNESGRSVAALSRFYKVPPERTVVVHDELDLPFGVLRVKVGGGPGGHNGVVSVIQAIGADFVRVRLGIGRPPGRKDPVNFVLENFRKAEQPEVPAIVGAGADAVLMVLREGVGPAQTFFNRRAAEEPT
jgi:peptidyl-tRNA hydrolase, PTH1 family